MTDNIQTEAQSEIPQRLYHYTNLESLALILTNKTIRLSPICDMDDPQEARASDVADLGRFVFASSWTDDEGESIPMWNMYASLGAGVRIGLPPMPFKRYRLTAEEYARAMGVPSDHVSTDSGRIESFLHPSIFADGLCSPSFMSGDGVLFKMEYTSDRSMLEPRVLGVDEGGNANINIGLLGRYKNKYWEFQHEWRYQLIVLPFDLLHMFGSPVARYSEMVAKMLLGKLPAPCTYYDLEIDDELLKQLEVVPSPKMTGGNRILLEMLLQRYGFESALRESALTGLL